MKGKVLGRTSKCGSFYTNERCQLIGWKIFQFEVLGKKSVYFKYLYVGWFGSEIGEFIEILLSWTNLMKGIKSTSSQNITPTLPLSMYTNRQINLQCFELHPFLSNIFFLIISIILQDLRKKQGVNFALSI